MNKALSALSSMALEAKRKKHPEIPLHAIPKPRYSDKTSNWLTKCVIDYIRLNGFQAERINSMGRQVDSRREVKDTLGNTRVVGSTKWIKGTSTVGTADISATILGSSVKIEIKCKTTGDRYQSKEQKAYQESIEKAGGTYIIVRDFNEFYEWMKNFKGL